MHHRIVRRTRPASFQFRDQRIRGVASLDPAAAGFHLERPQRRQLPEVLLVTLRLAGDGIQPLQILRVDEIGLLLLHELDDPRHRLFHHFHVLRIASGFEADLCEANPIGLVEQHRRVLRLVAARDQCIHAEATDKGDGHGQYENRCKTQRQFVAHLEKVHHP